MKLNELAVGQEGVIRAVGGEGALRQHILDMGVIPGVHVFVEKLAPMGDPMEIRLHGYELTLRLADAANIEVYRIVDSAYTSNSQEEAAAKEGINPEQNSEQNPEQSRKQNENTEKPSAKPKEKLKEKTKEKHHPGFGESGKYHDKKAENPLPDDTILTFGLLGNQNSGKTTLFNQLTGSNQHVGNFPGVTVDRKEGPIKGHPNTLITDLPGIYSMSPYSSEEVLSRNFVLEEKPKAIINIVDATNIERNLYLTMQLLEMGIPVVVALNMMDELTGNGGSIDINRMEELLGTPVVPISAAKNQGVDELIEHAIHIAHYQEKPLRQDFCDETDHGGAVHRCIHAVVHLIQDHAERAGLPVRFAADKAIEGDELVIEKLALDQNEKELLEHITIQMEKERGLDKSAAIADMRFAFIEKVCKEVVHKPKESKERLRSKKLDEIFTGKYTAIPLFVLIMVGVFYLTFNVIGAYLQELLEIGSL